MFVVTQVVQHLKDCWQAAIGDKILFLDAGGAGFAWLALTSLAVHLGDHTGKGHFGYIDTVLYAVFDLARCTFFCAGQDVNVLLDLFVELLHSTAGREVREVVVCKEP